MQISEAVYLWIFVGFLVIHLSEEFLGGTRLSYDPKKLHGIDLTPGGFIRTNLVAVTGLAISIVLALRFGFPQLLLVSLATFMLVNAVRHCVKSLKDVAYSPGLITGILIFLPLGVLTLIRLEQTMKLMRFSLGIGFGLIMQFGASFIAHRGRQFVQSVHGRSSERMNQT